MGGWTQKEQTQAEVKTHILDQFYLTLPRPPFSDDDADAATSRVFDYVWQRSVTGSLFEMGLAA